MCATSSTFPKAFHLCIYLELNFVDISQLTCVLIIPPMFPFELKPLKLNDYHVYRQI